MKTKLLELNSLVNEKKKMDVVKRFNLIYSWRGKELKPLKIWMKSCWNGLLALSKTEELVVESWKKAIVSSDS